MKRYKVIYFQGDRSIPDYLTELSKSGRRDGMRVYFYTDGTKTWQFKFKNNLMSGIDKDWWWKHPKNNHFTNWKKNKFQGIEINFNQ